MSNRYKYEDGELIEEVETEAFDSPAIGELLRSRGVLGYSSTIAGGVLTIETATQLDPTDISVLKSTLARMNINKTQKRNEKGEVLHE